MIYTGDICIDIYLCVCVLNTLHIFYDTSTYINMLDNRHNAQPISIFKITANDDKIKRLIGQEMWEFLMLKLPHSNLTRQRITKIVNAVLSGI